MTAAIPLPRLLTRQEVADLLRVSTDTVDRLARSGELTFIRARGRVLFDAEDVKRWVDERKAGRSASESLAGRSTFGSATRAAGTKSPQAQAILVRLRNARR